MTVGGPNATNQRAYAGSASLARTVENHGSALIRFLYTNSRASGSAAAVRATCSTSSSSAFIGLAAAHIAFAFDQSKNNSDQPRTLAGSVKPLLLHTISTVERLSAYDGGHGGSWDRASAERQTRRNGRMPHDE